MDETAIETTLETSQDKTATKRVGGKNDENPPPKKIVLNRKVVEAPDPPSQEPVTPEADKETAAPKVVSKIGSLTMNERLAKRKARFSDSSAVAPVIAVTTGTEAVAAPVVSTKVTIDVLKKRAERFGAVAPVLEKVCDFFFIKKNVEVCWRCKKKINEFKKIQKKNCELQEVS